MIKIKGKDIFDENEFYYVYNVICSNCDIKDGSEQYHEIRKGLTFQDYAESYVCHNCGIIGRLQKQGERELKLPSLAGFNNKQKEELRKIIEDNRGEEIEGRGYM